MSAVAVKKEVSLKWADEFEAIAGKRFGAVNKHIQAIQENAIQEFNALGIPDKKVEDYKYTNIKLYLNDEFSVGGEGNIKESDIKHLFIDGHAMVVIVNGKFSKELSRLQNIPKEVIVKSLFTGLGEHKEASEFFNTLAGDSANALTLLNTALACDGVLIYVPGAIACETPIHILNISTGNKKAIFNTRNLVKLDTLASATIIESYYSADLTEKCFTNSVTEFFVDKEAALQNYILQEESELARQNNIHTVSVGTAGRFNSTVITLNGGMVRNDLNMAIDGENAEIHMNGLFIVKNGHHIDNHTLVQHNVPNCFSNELYKGIMADGGTGVFNGKIFVKQDAQKTNAYQSNKNILLGDNASVNTKPQLEIYADDVKCSHGTTTGRLDETALFYLKSRGLNENLARKILLGAFAAEVSDTVKDEAFRNYLEQRIQDHIA